MSCSDIFLACIAVLFPPIAVWIKVGICTADSLINIALTSLGYLPGLIHAWYIIARNPEYDYDYQPLDNEQGGDRVTYYYVSHNQRAPGQGPGQMNYGGTANAGRGQVKANANANAPQQPSQAAQESGVVNNNASLEPQIAGASSTERTHVPGGDNAPPTYADAVKGDNKVQTDD